MPEITPDDWQEFLEGFPEAHILQTREWGELKTEFGWKARYLTSSSAHQDEVLGTQILFRRLPFGFSAGYIAKGPVGYGFSASGLSEERAFWHEVDQICHEEKAVFLKIEPDIWSSHESTSQSKGILADLPPAGFQQGVQSIQPVRTLVVDIRASEDEILARMKQKTRYNIRLAIKKGVAIKTSTDISAFYRLMQITSERDLFGVHTQGYYQKAFDLFRKTESCEMFTAEHEGQVLAALMVFRRGFRSWYFYGASSSIKREFMPTYLLQWAAIRWAKSKGCTTYDLWGVPDESEQTLEREFELRSTGLWGVYRFKRGFGGVLHRAAGPWDRVFKPFIYSAYRFWATRRGEQVD